MIGWQIAGIRILGPVVMLSRALLGSVRPAQARDLDTAQGRLDRRRARFEEGLGWVQDGPERARLDALAAQASATIRLSPLSTMPTQSRSVAARSPIWGFILDRASLNTMVC